MKFKNSFYKTTLLFLLFITVCVITVSAADIKFSDTFDNNSSYVVGQEPPNSSTGGKFVFTRNAVVEKIDDNNVVKLLKVDNATGRIIYDVADTWIEDQTAWNTWKESGEKIILSFDFMMKERNTNFELFNIQSYDYNAKNYDGANIPVKVLSDGNKIYLAGDEANPVVTGLKIKKWYNAQIIVDFKSQKYSVRIGENVKENISFAANVQNIVRIFSVTENAKVPLYVDNVEVASVNYEQLDKALYEAKSLVVSSDIGYNTGEYPQSAVTMLEDVYNEVYKDAVKQGANTSLLSEKITAAIAEFKSRKIVSAAADSSINHIRADIDNAIVVEYSGSTTYNLIDKTYVCDRANSILENKEIIWSVLSAPDGVTLLNGEITVESGTEGRVQLMAETEDGIYVKYTVMLIPIAPVEITEFNAIDGKIKITGKINKQSIYPITLRLIGDTIYHRGEIELDGNGGFVFEKTIPLSSLSQNVQFILEGKDIETLSEVKYYYGSGWESEAVAEFNGAASSNIETVLDKYAFAISLDKTLYSSYKEDYKTRLLNGKSYGNIEELKNEVRIANYIIAHSDSGRENIESVILNNLDLLSDSSIGGTFEKATFNNMSQTKKAQFYLDALQLSINPQEETLAGISTRLNAVMLNITNPPSDESEDTPIITPGTSTDEGNFGGGGGGGGGGGSYSITPVEKEKEQEKTPLQDENVEEFLDINECLWAKDALNYLKAKNIMVGYDNKVRPNDYVTRGEFAKIIVAAFNLTKADSTVSFTDTKDMWWGEFAAIAAANNIVNGFEDGSFGGNEIINREMLAVMVDRVITSQGIELYDKNESKDFKDSALISPYAQQAVKRLYEKGIVNGIGENVFAPSLSVTRAQAAQIIYSVLSRK